MTNQINQVPARFAARRFSQRLVALAACAVCAGLPSALLAQSKAPSVQRVQGNAENGKTLAMKGKGSAPACMGCHGANGEGQPAAGFPRLAGQTGYYLAKELIDWQQNRRTHPVMGPIAKALSDQDIADAASYYETLPAPAERTTLADGPGAQLAEHGDAKRQIIACANCHGPGGMGLPPNLPRLADQSATYIANQLQAWQLGQRTNDAQHVMTLIAHDLTPADIAAVSAYYGNSDTGKSAADAGPPTVPPTKPQAKGSTGP